MPKTIKTELLAPAGSLETFFAALENGADAVYAGLKDFSARAKAKNFTLEELSKMVGYAHSNNRKLYVTLNTIVKEPELTKLAETVSELEQIGVDALIVQDMGVARVARRHFPSLPLHASTQMTIHNSAGVKTLADAGFERVVLARELTLEELRKVIGNSPIEIECFIHGALCFSYSGQCYFSSFLGGHSGNRGRCAQPCRRVYHHQNKEGYYFSTNDFSAIDLIPELRDAGVVSFKIEGRMKSAEYVASVVSAYRMVLDASPSDLNGAVVNAKEQLKNSYGRLPTKGFLVSKTPTDIAIPSIKGATGRFLGVISAVKGGVIQFQTKEKIHVGERLRVQPKTDQAGKGFTLRDFTVSGKPAKAADAGKVVTVAFPFQSSVGDSVFKVSSEAAYTLSDSACRRRLENERARILLDIEMHFTDGRLLASASVYGRRFQYESEPQIFEESRTDDMRGVLLQQMGKTGDTPFAVRSFQADGFPKIMIPPSFLKNFRREFYKSIETEIMPEISSLKDKNLRSALKEIKIPSSINRSKSELIIRTDSLKDWAFLNIEGVSAISVPVSKASMHFITGYSGKLKGFEERVIWRLPFIIMEDDLEFYQACVNQIVVSGFKRFMLSNISHFELLKGIDAEISTDYRLYSLNTQALLFWRELGVASATLSIEDDATNMKVLLCADIPIQRSVIVYSPLHLITSRIQVKDLRKDTPVSSDRGDNYTVFRKDDQTVIESSKDFSIIQHRKALSASGCSSFQIDISEDQEARVRQVLDAWRTGRVVDSTVEGNFSGELV